MEHIDCVVIGAGVVGLAIARELAASGREVVILEEENAFGTHTSSRNSEVMHAGISYPAGTWKARLCRPGAAGLGMTPERQRRAGVSGVLPGERSPGLAPTRSPYWSFPMNHTEPTLAPPMPPSTIDFRPVFPSAHHLTYPRR